LQIGLSFEHSQIETHVEMPMEFARGPPFRLRELSLYFVADNAVAVQPRRGVNQQPRRRFKLGVDDAKTLSGFLCQSQIDTFDPTASRFATHCV
jgi:hypothetical protein